jgi:tetratricopeptide (TPR) repeat protein
MDPMRHDVAGTSLWCTLFAGLSVLGAGAAASVPVAVVAGGAIAGNIAAAKLQRMIEAFHEHRARTGAFGGRVDANHDEAKALRVAQLSAVRGLMRAVRPPSALLSFDTRRGLCDALDEWAGKAMARSDAQIERALRAAAPETLLRLTGQARGGQAVLAGDDLKALAEAAVWQELRAAVTIPDDADADWLKAAFHHRETGWFALFARQWHATLKTDPHVSAILQHMQLAMLDEKLDAVKDDTAAIRIDVAATRSGVEALPDVVAAAVRAELAAAGITREARERGLSAAQVEGILAAFGKAGLPPENWAQALLDSAATLQELQARLSALSNDEPETAALLQAAAAAIEAGDFDLAEARLAEAERRDLDVGIARLTRAARTRFERGELAQRLARYWDAGEHFEEAARLFGDHDPEQRARAHHAAGFAFCEHGQLFPGPGLPRAATNYRAALEVYTRDAMPIEWATMWTNLALTLQMQGERTGKAEGLTLLEQSVAGYHAALEVFTREAMPAQWAMIQNNLANTLSLQGERTEGAAGLALLTQGAERYRLALKVRIREAMPAEWANTQNNLANTRQTLGLRTDGLEGLALLRQSEEGYRAALEVRTREAMPVQWAMTQNNLANTLRALGGRIGAADGLDLLGHSAAGYRLALKVLTQEAMPVHWAGTQENLSICLLARFEMGGERAELVAAREAAEGALEEYELGGMEFYADKCRELLARIGAAGG